MKTSRPIFLAALLMAIITLTTTAALASPAVPAGSMEKISVWTSTGQEVVAWAKLGPGNTVLAAGVTLPYDLFLHPPDQPGTGPAGAIVVLPFPDVVRTSTFLNHFELNWEKHGHEPPVFMVPHFDFHFFTVPVDEVMKVAGPDPRPPQGKLIPAGYVYPGPEFAVPQMGVHAVRPSDLDRPFTDVLIFGFYGGRMTFIEPMVTRSRMMEKQDIVYEIPVSASPAAFSRGCPTRIEIRYDGKANTYDITFVDFVKSPPSSLISGK